MNRRKLTRGGLLALLVLLALLPFALRHAYSRNADGKPTLTPASLTDFPATERTPANAKQIQAAYGRLPLTFVPNRGQTDSRVRFSARAPGFHLAFTPQEAIFTFASQSSSSKPRLAGETPRDHAAALALRFVGANPRVHIEGERETPGKVNYLIGNDPDEWHTNLPTFEEVRYRDLWPGIDVVFRGAAGELKYDFVLRPGARVDTIRLAYRGAEKLTLDNDGNLQIRTALGTMTDARPVSWQEIAGRKVPVASRYALRQGADDATEYGFSVGAEYDPAYPLIIDPSLAYGTYLGGSGTDEAWAVALDAFGNACVTGWTNSSNFPTTSGAYKGKRIGKQDVFITKMNASGTGLVFSTYFGGSGDDEAREIALDDDGNIYLVGVTASGNNFPRVNAYDTTLGGPYDAFLAKLNASGSSVLYSTFLGGSGQDDCWGGLVVWNAQEVYVGGHTASSNFPLVGAFDTTRGGGWDAFVAKFNTNASGAASLVWSSYLGGSDVDTLSALAVDSAGNAYVTGGTSSPDFVSTYGLVAGAYDADLDPDLNDPDGLNDSYLAVVSASGTLTYASYRGGSSKTGGGDSLALYEPTPGAVTVYMAGRVAATSPVPTTSGAYDTTHNGVYDIYFMILRPDPADSNPDGEDTNELEYATFLGGSGTDRYVNVAADSVGNAYLHGQTSSTNFPTRNAFDTTLDGATDSFVAKLTPAGGGDSDLIYASYFGGASDEEPGNIVVDSSGGAYIVGASWSSGLFASNLPGYDKSKSGTNDAFLIKVNP